MLAEISHGRGPVSPVHAEFDNSGLRLRRLHYQTVGLEPADVENIVTTRSLRNGTLLDFKRAHGTYSLDRDR